MHKRIDCVQQFTELVCFSDEVSNGFIELPVGFISCGFFFFA